MKNLKLWVCGLVACACLVHLPAASAQFRRGVGRVIRRYPQLELQQAKQAAAMQKNYLEWSLKTQAEAAKQRAAHNADLQRKKAQAEVQREARVEKIKERNAQLAAHPKERSQTSDKTADPDKVEQDSSAKAKPAPKSSDAD